MCSGLRGWAKIAQKTADDEPETQPRRPDRQGARDAENDVQDRASTLLGPILLVLVARRPGEHYRYDFVRPGNRPRPFWDVFVSELTLSLI
jgi:hypothetical protein